MLLKMCILAQPCRTLAVFFKGMRKVLHIGFGIQEHTETVSGIGLAVGNETAELQ